jgi:hypothetical protein
MPAIARGLEVAARSRAVEDDSVAAVVGGERLDDLGKRLLFVHGRILVCRALSSRTSKKLAVFACQTAE